LISNSAAWFVRSLLINPGNKYVDVRIVIGSIGCIALRDFDSAAPAYGSKDRGGDAGLIEMASGGRLGKFLISLRRFVRGPGFSGAWLYAKLRVMNRKENTKPHLIGMAG
jgi:hypothetical protein